MLTIVEEGSLSQSNSVSVSNESMAGDSGVCEAQQRLMTTPPAGEASQQIHPPQLSISLFYDFDDSRLLITVEHGRNLRYPTHIFFVGRWVHD